MEEHHFFVLDEEGKVKLLPATQKGFFEAVLFWASRDNTIKKTKIDNVEISTIWLQGICHGVSNNQYIETMIFGGELDGSRYRYSDPETALKEHKELEEQIRNLPKTK